MTTLLEKFTSEVKPTTPLRLKVAARLAYPDGSMTATSLRRLIVDHKLAHEKIAGKYFVTLSAIEEMRASCHVPAKALDLLSKNPATDSPHGSSETDSGPSALAAMKVNAAALRESLRTISSKSTTRRRQ
jgi:hypothetical protein